MNIDTILIISIIGKSLRISLIIAFLKGAIFV